MKPQDDRGQLGPAKPGAKTADRGRRASGCHVAGVVDPGSGMDISAHPAERLSFMDEPHGHLRRLTRVWSRRPVFFVTACVHERRALLANETAHAILREEWQQSLQRHGWAVGRYVIMPDHVHFFLAPAPESSRSLSMVVGKWKEWTAKRLLRELGGAAPVWQPEFFDHLLRSNEAKREKWAYVRENPVRARLVAIAEDWPYAGSIDFE